MAGAAALADFFRYPSPGFVSVLTGQLSQISEERAQEACAAFLDKVEKLTLGEWEELYTRTLDITPPIVPYIGFQIWGESYQRGNFLAQMNRAICTAGVDAEGELPDHLLPVLRYLDAVQYPIPELLDALLPAIKKMQTALRKADPENPYNFLLEAAWQTSERFVAAPAVVAIQAGGSE